MIHWAFFSSNILFQHFLSFILFLLQSYTVYKHYGQMLPKRYWSSDQVMIHISSLLMPFRQHFLTKRAAYKDIFRHAFIVTVAGGSEMTPIYLSLWTLTILRISVLELCIIQNHEEDKCFSHCLTLVGRKQHLWHLSMAQVAGVQKTLMVQQEA